MDQVSLRVQKKILNTTKQTFQKQGGLGGGGDWTANYTGIPKFITTTPFYRENIFKILTGL